MTIQPRKELEKIIPYEPGKPIADVQREFGLRDIIKLASNENPLGSSRKALDAIRSYIINGVNIYPDGNATDLKSAIAEKFTVQFNEILPSNGADEMLELVAKTYLNSGDESIISTWTFSRYLDATNIMGAKPVVVPMDDFTYDLSSFLKAITNKTKIIWLCNPNNPTGTYLPESEILSFFRKVPNHIVIVYDEAYAHYADNPNFPKHSENFIREFDNVIVIRTFSKIYGLAGLRVGYALSHPENIRNINKVRGPFNVNVLSQIAATAALDDDEFIKKAYDTNLQGKYYFYQSLNAMGLKYWESQTNHILIDVGKDGREVFLNMQKMGVIIRPMLSNYIRISIGTMDENRKCISVLKAVLSDQQS